MEEKSESRRDRRHLKALLDAAGYTSTRHGDVGYNVQFGGKYRGWEVRVGLRNGWLTFTVYFMHLPEVGAVRNRLFERVCEINDAMSISKFVKFEDSLTLDMEYRAEHVDSEALASLIGLLCNNAEQYYPEIFRIVTGEETLATLQEAYGRVALPKGAD
ncbi:MAG: YbjN domain-containing protein [Candidatus Eremiobacteraeota bacterium]|nr:YbjN domain-containing protein [Candidatus Eremiobacteraeota bacterium]